MGHQWLQVIHHCISLVCSSFTYCMNHEQFGTFPALYEFQIVVVSSIDFFCPWWLYKSENSGDILKNKVENIIHKKRNGNKRQCGELVKWYSKFSIQDTGFIEVAAALATDKLTVHSSVSNNNQKENHKHFAERLHYVPLNLWQCLVDNLLPIPSLGRTQIFVFIRTAPPF